jgi:hydroxymethylpyrimidine pyrophosphatase-like HAD family hydrolase
MNVKAFAIDIDGTLTENGGGIIHLGSLSMLRTIEKLGYRVIFVTGRSSIEAYVLSVFAGTTKIAVGENMITNCLLTNHTAKRRTSILRPELIMSK